VKVYPAIEDTIVLRCSEVKALEQTSLSSKIAVALHGGCTDMIEKDQDGWYE
jgi:hypothetical protein